MKPVRVLLSRASISVLECKITELSLLSPTGDLFRSNPAINLLPAVRKVSCIIKAKSHIPERQIHILHPEKWTETEHFPLSGCKMSIYASRE